MSLGAWLRRILFGAGRDDSAAEGRDRAAEDEAGREEEGEEKDDDGSDETEQEGGSASDDVVRLPIQDSIDLHTFAPRDVPSLVEEYVREARLAGFAEVRVIHGRGKGVQRAVVRKVLASHPDVESFVDAPPSRGGWGATIVRLRPHRGD